MTAILLSAKTKLPQPFLDTVHRTRLLDNSPDGRYKKVTILRAPAGYGKTTLISQWLKNLQHEQVAYLSIDSSDNDAPRYWKYVLHAVAKACHSDMDQTFAPLLHASDSAGNDFLIESFIHELSVTDKPLHIVLDDYHLIENTVIHQMMTKLIEQLPDHVHIYIATRTEIDLPITKWRVKQWVYELDASQLRFTPLEVEQFYRAKNLPLPDQAQFNLIVDKTEGWIAGLQLACLTPNHDYPLEWETASRSTIFSFLVQEIMLPLPLSTQEFLLRTSLINELEPSICNQLTNRTDSFQLLEELEKKGFFIVRLQSNNPVFRYHHLFAEALQSELRRRLTAEDVSSLVQESAILLYKKGLITSAIDLCLHYELYDIAVSWMTDHLVNFITSGRTATFLRWLHHLRSHHHPVPYELLVIGVIASMSSLDTDIANSLIQELETRQITDQWMEQEEHAPMVFLYEHAKAMGIISVGGDLKIAKAIVEKQLNKNHVPSRWDTVHMPFNIFEYKLLRTSISSKGKMPAFEDGLAIAEIFRKPFYQTRGIAAYSYGTSAESLYERNLLDYAKDELDIAMQQGHELKDPGLFIPMYLLQAKIYLVEKKTTSALALLTQAKTLVTEKHWLTTLSIMQAACHITNGDLNNAEIELQATKSSQPFWMLVYARLLLAKQQPDSALEIVIQTKTKAMQEMQVATFIEATVLEAICHQRLGDKEMALTILLEALKAAAPYYYIRTFLDEEEIYTLLNKARHLHKKEESLRASISLHYIDHFQIIEKQTDELLTPREKEVYDLLTDGITNREIAEQLFLSEGTVRVYLTSIYSKIGVDSRAKAILLKYQ
ncbi:LuxR C-terminal-related transcriptional regulator [Sporosarcina oncorhynchi]|uniref:LuxR C-terminal-related transcriptional regulator n=1 Tax=Sporosarcina oncorhynchi TaxID=3056444 RepID=A0ABZ0L7Z4_9BACL|nr:LuxR C-terminal-related transcriptional regulator [Sporosarcina sp. T2O-4]WOV88063.1 LuxR C-terminal-related transcriptional regulator [Sporosarcina sp. T2O-4]